MKFFAVSDIHSFASDLKHSLYFAGFRKRDKNNTLLVLGDIFDRGSETLEVYKFLKSIPKKRRVLIRGNHEELFLELLKKPFPQGHDFSNGTVSTFVQIAGYAESDVVFLRGCYYYYNGTYSECEGMSEEGQELWNDIKKIVAGHEITNWLQSDEWVNYYELGPYIFVHSFIPLENLDGLPDYYARDRQLKYIQDWRNIATDEQWRSATWGCPYLNYDAGLFCQEAANGKILVCGHWHTSDFFKNYTGKELNTADIGCIKDTIWFGKHLIGLDGGVWRNWMGLYHPQNVLVFDEATPNECYDSFGNKLTVMD